MWGLVNGVLNNGDRNDSMFGGGAAACKVGFERKTCYTTQFKFQLFLFLPSRFVTNHSSFYNFFLLLWGLITFLFFSPFLFLFFLFIG